MRKNNLCSGQHVLETALGNCVYSHTFLHLLLPLFHDVYELLIPNNLYRIDNCFEVSSSNLCSEDTEQYTLASVKTAILRTEIRKRLNSRQDSVF